MSIGRPSGPSRRDSRTDRRGRHVVAVLAVALAVTGAHSPTGGAAPERPPTVRDVSVPIPPADEPGVLPDEDSARPARPGDGRTAPPHPPGAGVPAPGARYAWPLFPPPAVVTPFRAPPHPYGRGHRGVDLAGSSGQAVLAARDGGVVFAGPLAGRGVVSLRHDDGLRTTYEPLAPSVAAGAAVRAGDVLGTLEPGHSGCPGACLHWGARRDRLEYLDPLVLLRPARVRLLPVPERWPGG